MRDTVIFLVGFMGCGKSTFGRYLSKQLGYAFIDTDTFIEERTLKTIPQIFAEDGEHHFRQWESEAIEALSTQVHCVIATGGGAPCYNENMDRMNALGRTVYLELSPELLAQRLSLDSTERPVLEGKSGNELIAHITAKLSERESFYQQSTFVVNADQPEDLLGLL